MKKLFLAFSGALFTLMCSAQTDVPPYSGGPNPGGSMLTFSSGGPSTFIQESWGLNIAGDNLHPVKIPYASFSIGYSSDNQDFGLGNLYVKGNVGIGTITPQAAVDISGNLILRNYSNVKDGGSSIHFTSYGDTTIPGPKIRSALVFAGTPATTVTKLVLSSYAGGYKNELTLYNGMVGIGTSNPQEALSVNGNIRSKQVKVETANWPDYVFDEPTKIGSLKSVKKYIAKHGRLSEVPSEIDIARNGQNLGEVNKILLKKIEELTVYLIQKDEELGRIRYQLLHDLREIALIKKAMCRANFQPAKRKAPVSCR